MTRSARRLLRFSYLLKQKSLEEAWGRTKKSGLKAVTLISTPNPVSQVLW